VPSVIIGFFRRKPKSLLSPSIAQYGRSPPVDLLHRRPSFPRRKKEKEESSFDCRLLQYVFASLSGSHELLRGTGRREQEQFRVTLKSDAARRQSFLLAVTKRTAERIDIFHLIRAGLLQREDFHWVLTQCSNGKPGGSSVNGETLCNMIEMAFDRDDQSHFQALYDAALKWPPLWNHFRGVFEGVPLDSADAHQLRKNQRMLKELEDRRPPPVMPPPAERVAKLLNQFEAGGWRKWSDLNRELTLTPTSTVYGDDLEYSITRMPGWIAADATTRQRIVGAAEQYLTIGETSIKEWIGFPTLIATMTSIVTILSCLQDSVSVRSLSDRASSDSPA
jgi:hypothetical protein